MAKRILIATGGTGGHIYPAIALAQKFAREQKDAKVLFTGGGLCQNRYFDRSLDFRSISCGAFTNKSPLALMGACLNISKGVWQSRKLIREFKPDVAVGFGSYYSFPPLLAAKLQGVPVILHEANSIPGKVNRILAPYALATGVHFPQTLGLVKGCRYEVGMPLRNGFEKGSVQRSEAMRYFDFDVNDDGLYLKTMLVFGGSQGANVINRSAPEALALLDGSGLLKVSRRVQVVHIAGEAGLKAELVEAYARIGVRACVKVFEERMDLAWQAADFVISRAGASSVAEQLEFEVPGVLIPFARAADDHQNHNANFLVDDVGGAVKVLERNLNGERLAGMIAGFLDNVELSRMRNAMVEYKRKSRGCDLYALINKLC